MSRRFTVVLVGATMAALVLVMAGAAGAQDIGCKGDIVLDPGHGGTDMGAVYNKNGISLTEKAEVLEVAYFLKGLLQDGYGPYYDVCMTRTSNSETLSNKDRYTNANTTGAKILVSIHMNGSSSDATDYTTTLFGKWQKDKALALTVFNSLSALPSASGTGTIATRTPYSYASGVLLKSNMPATIAETVFIPNTREAQLLSAGTTRHQQIAAALEQGINNYLK
jgi:N-acetylmuramoyl-L-alanine amidase